MPEERGKLDSFWDEGDSARESGMLLFSEMVAGLAGDVDNFCRRLRVEESAERLIRGHLTGSLELILERIKDSMEKAVGPDCGEGLASAMKHLDAMVFWLGQLEHMNLLAHESAKTCRLGCENLAKELKTLSGSVGARPVQDWEIGAERRRDFHLRDLVENRDFDAALLYIDAIVQLGEANENPVLAGKYRGFRQRVVQIKETVN